MNLQKFLKFVVKDNQFILNNQLYTQVDEVANSSLFLGHFYQYFYARS